mmetsp:Transcript_55450/g.179838  ORF Transcript_55450/g.179838 Transcript_55450/m.179838 type:complete len:348 (-) Transcript_55450:133-1176(-)
MAMASASPSCIKGLFSTPLSVANSSPLSMKSVSPSSQFERVESNIGEGTYGKVHKARDRETGRLVAIKKAKASKLDTEVGGVSITALREIKLMQAVQHPNVMGYLEVFVEAGALHIVMDYMDGDLRKLIEDKGLVLNETHVKCLSRQILEGLAALHQEFFVHRDLSPGNILLSFNTGVARIGDFGFSRTIGHRDRPLTPMCTTMWYRAPELFYGAKYYGQTVDIWSVGCLIAEMFLREPFFQGKGEFDMMQKIFEKTGTPTEEVWKDVSALPVFLPFSAFPRTSMAHWLPGVSTFAQSLVDGLLALDPKQRPSAQDTLRHQFFGEWPAACRPAELPFVFPAGGAAAA